MRRHMKDGNSSLKNLALISACAKPIMLLSRHQVPSVWIQNAAQCFESRFDDVDALLELLQKPNVSRIEAERASARSEEQVQVLTTKVEKQCSLLKDSTKLACQVKRLQRENSYPSVSICALRNAMGLLWVCNKLC